MLPSDGSDRAAPPLSVLGVWDVVLRSWRIPKILNRAVAQLLPLCRQSGRFPDFRVVSELPVNRPDPVHLRVFAGCRRWVHWRCYANLRIEDQRRTRVEYDQARPVALRSYVATLGWSSRSLPLPTSETLTPIVRSHSITNPSARIAVAIL